MVQSPPINDIAILTTQQEQSVNSNVLPSENDGSNFAPFLNEASTGQQQSIPNQEVATEGNKQLITTTTLPDTIMSGTVTPDTIVSDTVAPVIIAPVTIEAKNLNSPGQNPTTTALQQLPSLSSVAVLDQPTEKLETATLKATTIDLTFQQAGTPTTNTSKAETLLLSQIQKIIDEGKNNGAIIIKSDTNPALTSKEHAAALQSLSPAPIDATSTSPIQVKQTDVSQWLPGDKKIIPSPTSSNIENSRQGVNEQYLNAKFGETKQGSEDQANNQQNDQKGNDQQNKSSVLNAASSTAPTTTEPAVNETSFSQQLNTSNLIITPKTGTIEGKFAPGATQVVPEKELVDNLIQRFNVNPRLQTSRVTLQLHPVELGQLKVDILVKGDVVSANIIAHSPKIIETLDKNMNRLRGVLEDQGFTVDSLKISLETDKNQQNPFQENFNSRKQFATQSKKMPSKTNISFDPLLNNQENISNQNSNGVNVTA